MREEDAIKEGEGKSERKRNESGEKTDASGVRSADGIHQGPRISRTAGQSRRHAANVWRRHLVLLPGSATVRRPATAAGRLLSRLGLTRTTFQGAAYTRCYCIDTLTILPKTHGCSYIEEFESVRLVES